MKETPAQRADLIANRPNGVVDGSKFCPANLEGQIIEAIRHFVAEEREACAQAVESVRITTETGGEPQELPVGAYFAEVIRARANP